MGKKKREGKALAAATAPADGEEDMRLTVPPGWKEPAFKPEDNPPGLFAESSFSTLFPTYREKYIRDCWPILKAKLDEFKLKGDLNLMEGSMTVKTTRHTWDPYAVIKGRDVLKLLARSVPVEQAIRVLEDDQFCDIIKIGKLVRNKERFVKRRQRILGPDGQTLKAIELLTNCYVLLQGNTVSAIGAHQGLKEVRKIVDDAMKNIHPVYNIKTLMIKHELMKIPEMKEENWERFLPQYKKTTISKRKQPLKKKTKRPYTPFPPAPLPSKVDLQLESGEYFLNKREQKSKHLHEKRTKQHEVMQSKKTKRDALYTPPAEKKVKESSQKADTSVDIEKLKKKVGKIKTKS